MTKLRTKAKPPIKWVEGKGGPTGLSSKLARNKSSFTLFSSKNYPTIKLRVIEPTKSKPY